MKITDLHAALVQKHGDSMPPAAAVDVGSGWYPLIDKLITDSARRHPLVAFRGFRGGGWLRITHSVPDIVSVLERAKIEKFLQGYVTESTWTCQECAGQKGEHVRANADVLVTSLRDRVLCPSCRAEHFDIKKSMPLVFSMNTH